MRNLWRIPARRTVIGDEIMQVQQSLAMRWPRLFFLLAVFTYLISPVRAQNGPSPGPTPTAVAADYKIGPGDTVSVTVMDAPEFGGKFRVSERGLIEMTGINEPIRADDKTPSELAHAIKAALIDAKQLRDPKVTVFVEEYRGRTIEVLGSVAKPSVYPIQKRTTLLEALSLAGGALPGAGDTITVVRGEASAEATSSQVGTVRFVQLSKLVNGSAENLEVRNGDVVSVSAAQVVCSWRGHQARGVYYGQSHFRSYCATSRLPCGRFQIRRCHGPRIDYSKFLERCRSTRDSSGRKRDAARKDGRHATGSGRYPLYSGKRQEKSIESLRRCRRGGGKRSRHLWRRVPHRNRAIIKSPITRRSVRTS